MMDRPWLNRYPADVPAEISALQHRCIPELLRQSASSYSKQIAFTQCNWNGMNGSLRFEQVDHLSDQFAAWLRDGIGLARGERVAIQLPNCLSSPVAAFGVLKAGCVLVNTNPLYTAMEMTHQFADADVRALVIIDMFADRLPAVLPKTRIEHVVTVRISEFFPPIVATVIRIVQRYWDRSIPAITVPHTPLCEVLEKGRRLLDAASAAGTDPRTGWLEDVTEDTLALLQYTGGTTGIAKGAMLSHGNLLANVEQMLALAGGTLRRGEETILTALPLYHIFAFTVALLTFYSTGNRNILIPSPRPPGNLKRAFENYRITWLPGVNTLFNALLNERWFAENPPRHLVASVAGGMALHVPVAHRWRDITGTAVVEGYGLSEAAPVLSFNPLDDSARDGSIGLPVPSTVLSCVDDAGNPVPVGEPGEIVASGPQIMQGYWRRPEESEDVLKDGRLHTGDIGRMDVDGYFYLVDRKKDMIIVSGFKVYPNEVEEVIATLPGVQEVGVAGYPDPERGEAVMAFVVRSAATLTEEDVITHCRSSLARYKVPRKVEFRDELPRNLIGKILRRELRPTATLGAAGTEQGTSGCC
jgi:long-chain acyl-CoA synthetase